MKKKEDDINRNEINKYVLDILKQFELLISINEALIHATKDHDDEVIRNKVPFFIHSFYNSVYIIKQKLIILINYYLEKKYDNTDRRLEHKVISDLKSRDKNVFKSYDKIFNDKDIKNYIKIRNSYIHHHELEHDEEKIKSPSAYSRILSEYLSKEKKAIDYFQKQKEYQEIILGYIKLGREKNIKFSKFLCSFIMGVYTLVIQMKFVDNIKKGSGLHA